MNSITVKDGTQIYYKDWGKCQPIVLSHGWPLSADDWDAQMMFFLNYGFRVTALAKFRSTTKRYVSASYNSSRARIAAICRRSG